MFAQFACRYNSAQDCSVSGKPACGRLLNTLCVLALTWACVRSHTGPAKNRMHARMCTLTRMHMHMHGSLSLVPVLCYLTGPWPAPPNPCASRMRARKFSQAPDTSKHGGGHGARRPGLSDLDRSARNGAAFLLRPSMHPEGASARGGSAHHCGASGNPSVHAARRSMASDLSVHRAGPSLAGGIADARAHMSFSGSAESSMHRSHRGSAQSPPPLALPPAHLLPFVKSSAVSPQASSSNSLLSPHSHLTEVSLDCSSPPHSRGHAHHPAWLPTHATAAARCARHARSSAPKVPGGHFL